MVYKGVARGKTIELEQRLPYPEWQALSVSVEPAHEHAILGSPDLIRRTIHQPPHLEPRDLAELEDAIENGRLPVRQEERRRT